MTTLEILSHCDRQSVIGIAIHEHIETATNECVQMLKDQFNDVGEGVYKILAKEYFELLNLQS